MKKTVSLILAIVMCLGLFAACAGGNQNLEAAKDYLQNLYKNKAEITAADYTVVGTLAVNQETFTVEWSVNVNEGVKIVTGENGKVTVDVDEKSSKDIPYVLTATIKDSNGGSIQISFNHKVPAFKELTHAEFMAKENEEAVVIKGVITGIVETTKENDLYLQDTDGGYFVYKLEKKPSEMGLKIGMTVRVSGIRSTYSGIAQVADPSVEILDSNINAVAPTDITDIYKAADGLDADELVDMQSMLVTIKGATVLGQSQDNDTYWCFTLAGNQSYVRISSSTSMLTKEQDTAFKKAVNDHIGYASDITGLVSLYNGKVYLVPVDDKAFSNFVVAERTPAEQVAFEKELLQGLTSVNEAGTYDLITAPKLYNDVKISWAVSANDYAKIENGKLIVSLPDQEVKVTLTATLTAGEVTDTATYELVISAAPTLIPEIVNAPAVGTGYKFFLKQKNIGKTLYFAGGMDGNYLAATADPTKAADIFLEAADKAGEYYLYYMDGSIKTYIFIYEYTAGKAGIKVSTHKDDTVACTWTYNAEINSVVTTVKIGGADKVQYLGTYGIYETFSTSEISYASQSTSFAAQFATLTDTTKISDTDKVAAEKAELILPETVEQNAVIDLPIFGSTFTQVKITWAADDDSFVIEGNKLTVTPEAAGKTVNVTATIASGEVSDTKVFAITVSVLVPTVVDAPEAGVEYFFALKQENLDKMLYITGEMNGYYYQTTEDSAAAVKVVLEAVAGEEGKFYLYAMINGTKTYLNIVKSDDGAHTNVKYGTTAISKYVFNTEYKTLTTDLEDGTYYFGTYGTYNTFSASKIDKIGTSFPSHFYVMAPGIPETPDEPETPDVPETPDTNDATIADVLAGEMGTTFTVTGTVVGVNAQSFLLKDESGMILVYKGKNWTADVAVGDNVTVTGASTTYGGAVQFGTDATYAINSNGSFTQPTPAVPTVEELDAYLDKSTVTPAYVKVTGTLAVSGNYFNLTIDGATIVGSLTYLSAEDKEAITALNEKLIVVEGYITGVTGSSTKYLNLMVINCYEAGNAPVEPAGPTIADVLAGEMGTTFTVTGTVVGVNAQSFLLKDESGMILVYKGKNWTADVAVGDNVTVTGASTTYGGAVQFGTDATYAINSNGSFTQPTPAVPTVEELDAYKDMNPITPVYVKVTGTLAVSGNYFNLTIDGATIVGSLTYLLDDDKAAATALNGKLIVVEGYITGNASSGKFLNLMVIDLATAEEETPDIPETPDVPAAPSIVTAPEAGVEYYFALVQENKGQTLYINGAMSGYYYATTENADEAIKVVLEAVEGEDGKFYLYAMINGTKTYLNIVKSDDGAHTNVKYGTTAISQYEFNTEYNTLTTVLEDGTYYFGTYGNYNTFSASTIDKAATSFVAHFYPASTEDTPDIPETPDVPAAPSIVTAPEAGVEYYFALVQENKGQTLYINGAMSGYYYATTENADEAIKVVLEAVADKAGTYYLYAMIDGVKTYLNIEQSGRFNNVKYGTTAITEYTFNTEYNTLTTVLGENTLYFGTYGTYNTFSASTIDKAATSFVAHFYTVA